MGASGLETIKNYYAAQKWTGDHLQHDMCDNLTAYGGELSHTSYLAFYRAMHYSANCKARY